jgi:uncharacterized repeat protein (TIGR03803 family)
MRARRQTLFCPTISLSLGLLTVSARADRLMTLHHFGNKPAEVPVSNLAIDSKGDIYGAGGGGKFSATVWEVLPVRGKPGWAFKILWKSPNTLAGGEAAGGVIRDRRGNLFGTASYGGNSHCGTVFEIYRKSDTWIHRTLWSFNGVGGNDGCVASAALVMDGSGAVYGNTVTGGTYDKGTVFKLSPHPGKWTESIIWSFDGTDGCNESAQMNFDGAGNLYGTSADCGGTGNDGTVWELTPPAKGKTRWTREVLWTFAGLDGAVPTPGPMVMDDDGNLYGTCQFGGANGPGSVFELTPPGKGNNEGGKTWTETTIWSFTGGRDGAHPTSGAALGANGVLVGATAAGTIYKLIPPAHGQTNWSEKTLWTFNGRDGSDPEMPPLLLHHGIILGTTRSGGLRGDGTVWELLPK